MSYQPNTAAPRYVEGIKSLHAVLGAEIKRNSHAVLADLGDLFALRQIEEGYYARISTPGQLGLWYYSSPLHNVEIRVTSDYAQNERFAVHFLIGNMDDGMWSAWSKYFNSKAEAVELADKIAPFLEDLLVLPTEEELNEMLRPFGLFGQFE